MLYRWRAVAFLSVCLVVAAGRPAIAQQADSEPLMCEGGGEQTNSDGAASLVILIDLSRSMNDDNRLENAKSSARQAVMSLDPEDEVALITFCGGVNSHHCVPDATVQQGFTTNKQQVIDILPGLQTCGWTSLALGLETAGKYLKENARNDNKSMLVLSDGEETCGGNPNYEVAYNKGPAARYEANISTISLVEAEGDDPPPVADPVFGIPYRIEVRYDCEPEVDERTLSITPPGGNAVEINLSKTGDGMLFRSAPLVMTRQR